MGIVEKSLRCIVQQCVRECPKSVTACVRKKTWYLHVCVGVGVGVSVCMSVVVFVFMRVNVFLSLNRQKLLAVASSTPYHHHPPHHYSFLTNRLNL